MSFSEKGSADESEAMVDAITIENPSLNEPKLTDFNILTELHEDLTLNNDVGTEDQVVMEDQEMVEHEEEVETEVVGNNEVMEMEIEENAQSEDSKSKTMIPPLRPLTIAPKPPKLPVVKPVPGQQFLLVQGGNAGQAIKLLSPQGQELNVAGLISRPVTLKPTFKTVQSQGNIALIQQKPLVVKKIITPGQKTVTAKPIAALPKTGQHFMVVQKANTDQQQLKLIQSPNSVLSGTTKTITLQQAQEMGLLTNTKVITQQTLPKQTLLLKNPSKTVRLLPQVTSTLVSGAVSAGTKTISLATIKTPTKILPATSIGVTKAPQRIILKTSGSNPTIIPPGQIIQVTGSQGLNSGQLHQINIPGKGMQYIKFVPASTPEAATTTTSSSNVVKTSTNVTSTTNIVLSEVKPITVSKQLAPKPPKPIVPTTTKPSSQMVVIPALSTALSSISKVAIPPSPTKSTPKSTPNNIPVVLPNEEVETNGMRPRKPCNCTKSQCLKLYCDCFANGEFCFLCKCMNCFNNLENEVHRTRAIKACLERNPLAFKPKIGKDKDVGGDMSVRKHTKGCNCKRSGCLKNYCECYEAKIACSNNCKCIGCCNLEDSLDKRPLRSVEKATNTLPTIAAQLKDFSFPRHSSAPKKQTINFITDQVIDATCQCLLAISSKAEEEEDIHDEETIKRLIIQEFGRCLTEIIDYSTSCNLS